MGHATKSLDRSDTQIKAGPQEACNARAKELARQLFSKAIYLAPHDSLDRCTRGRQYSIYMELAPGASARAWGMLTHMHDEVLC